MLHFSFEGFVTDRLTGINGSGKSPNMGMA